MFWTSNRALARRIKAVEEHLEHVGARIGDMVDAHYAEFRKLRGQFHAAKHGMGEVEAAPTRSESKADVLRRIGYVPGQAAPHK